MIVSRRLILDIFKLRHYRPDGLLAKALGRDFKGKVSVVLYLVAIAARFVAAWVSHAIYIGVALMWLLPDRRIERTLTVS